MMTPQLIESKPEALDDSLFSFLVRYHYNRNLKRCLKRIDGGRVMYDGIPINEGEENELTQGLLIVKDGDTLDEIINKHVELWQSDNDGDSHDPHFTNLDGMDLEGYLRSSAKLDGAFLMSDTQISEPLYFYDVVPEARRKFGVRALIKRLPSDFIIYDRDIFDPRKLGAKTHLAVTFPALYDNLKSYQIKRSAYTELGLGKVTVLGREGMEYEFFFDTVDPEMAEDMEEFLFDKNHHIVGRLRVYAAAEGRVSLTSDIYVKPGWVLNPL